jgi:amino acid adenylation domain-containing protein
MSTGFRLSAQQERVWTQTGEQTKPRWAECEVLLEGALDVSTLHQSVQNVVRCHEVLRTVFRRRPELKLPFQVIQDGHDFAWQTVDLRGLGPCDQRMSIQTLVRAQREALSLENGPTLAVLLALVAPETHVLILSLPSLCTDLRGLWNLVGEISRSYAEDDTNRSDVLQYVDFVEWQQELLSGEDTRKAGALWRDYCRTLDLNSENCVPSESGKTRGAEFAPGVVVKEVPSSLFDVMIRLSDSHGTSVEDCLLACWQIFLSRITDQSTITIGYDADGRTHEELRDALGLFAKCLPIHLTTDYELSFRALVEQTRTCVSAALSWQDGFAWRQLKSPVGEPHRGWLGLTFDFAKFPLAQIRGGVKFSAVREEGCTELSNIRLSARQRAESLAFEFHYDAGSWERDAIVRFSDHFLTLLAAAVDKPETPAGRLPLLSEAERHRVLVEWNHTDAEYPHGRCVHELFEDQVVRTPERIAVRCADRRLSYRELNEEANRLAHYLRSRGIGANDLVGLRLDRSVDAIVALLAILKAGGAYVPLSPDNPKARLAQQLTGASALIAEETTLEDLPECGVPIIYFERDKPKWANAASTNPSPATKPENLVYVIYTSGSTGVPKGVAIRHRNLVNYTWFITRLLNLCRYSEGLHFGAVSTLSADLGNTCIYPSLISGGCLHVIPFEVSTDSKLFLEYAKRHAIDVLKIVPSHLATLLDAENTKELLPRRYLITGGESLSRELVEKIRALQPDCEIINHYGPTETTIGSLTFRLAEYDGKRSTTSSIPIGRPIANTRIYILDARRELVPVGVAGELVIAGAGVAAGYLNQPESTAERFCAEVFRHDPDERMYRTGDLARYLPDGNVEFLGRSDDQVKIRGFRIELGEVEGTLTRHNAVSQAVVIARPDERGDRRLIAYVVAKRDQPLGVDMLRDWLRGQLPDYMLPSSIVLLPQLPLTSNGKIDRRSLPDPAQVSAGVKNSPAPRNATEGVIERIWAEVLRLDRVGVEDNFFAIGGHSLLATQVISRIRRAFNVTVPLRCLFESPTIVALAEVVDQMQREAHGVAAPPITPAARDQLLPLSFGQQRLWTVAQLEPNSCRYSVPRAIRLTGILNPQALAKALNSVVERHEVLRTTYVIQRGWPVQVIAQKASIALPVEDLSMLPAADREKSASRILHAEVEKPFNLETDTVFRARLLKLGTEDHILFLNTHHIASDGWSFGVLKRDLAIFYQAALDGTVAPLSPLPIQYADYAVWQRTWLQGEVLETQLAYWRSRLDGAPPVLALPTDRPRPAVRTLRGAVHQVLLPDALADRIRMLSQREGATVFMTMLAAFQCLIVHYSDQLDVVIGTDVAGRNDVRTEDLVGFFVNLLVLRTDLSGNPAFQECISRARETALGAYSHQEVPFDRVVEELRPKRSRAYYPLVQVLFSQRNTPQRTQAIPGVAVSAFELGCNSIMDLYVSFADTPRGFACVWVYNSDLFDADTIIRMADLYRATLEEASANPGVRLNELRSLLMKMERQKREDNHRGLLEAARETLTSVPQANQVHGELSSWETEPAAPAPF